MKRLLMVFLAGCAHAPPPVPPVGHESRPYSTLPEYFQQPIAEHELTGPERVEEMSRLLRDIDARAAGFDGTSVKEDELKLRVRELGQVVPPTPGLLSPVERMKIVLEDSPRTPPEDTRRRLWALTDLIRLRAHF
jgi:hypothetical protein